MMKFTITAHRRDTPLAAHISGDQLTLNGETYDFGPLLDGQSLPPHAIDSDWIGPDGVKRVGGDLIVHLILPYSRRSPDETITPPGEIEAVGGPVPLPPYGPLEPDPEQEPEAE